MSNANQGDKPAARECMPLIPALQVLLDVRREDQIVITSMGSAREWPKLSDHALDFHYVPSTMGGAVPLGLGLALAQPDREVLVIVGDGSLLMNLGCLVTVIGSGATNLSIALVDNGVYEVTGGQETAAASGGVNYAGLAQAAAYPNVGYFHSLADWRRRASDLFTRPGPRFFWLVVEPVREDYMLDPPRPMGEQVGRLTKALGVPR
jgi:thiamine pyrophosphate-dependent acetolactate synthase large subunit-like protein